MTTEELRRKIEADGIEAVLRRYEGEPEDDSSIAALWEEAHNARVVYEKALDVLMKRISNSKG